MAQDGPRVTKLAFEKYYDDQSGVRAAVRYDSTKDDAVSIVSVSEDWTASLPAEDLDWLIHCLERIRAEI